MMRNPLVRSTHALQGLFHRGVVVSEADGDRAFYTEINRKLRDVDRGVDDALFLNARGWASIGQMVGPLRKLGIPTACILDFDALSRPGGEWQGLLRTLNLTRGDLQTLRNDRAGVEKAVKANPGSKTSGLRVLSGAERQAASRFIAELARLGIFIVPNGALESWLSPFGVLGSKDSWVAGMLAKLGSDSVRPGQGDVWAFVSAIAKWTSDPLRAGMGA
jgi:hypothetical protein